MAYDLTATLIQPLRSAYSDNINRNVQRRSNLGVYDLFLEQTNSPMGILDADLNQKIQDSFGNSVSIPVLNYQDVTLSNVRTCAVQTSTLTSALVPVTFVTASFGIAIARSMFKSNTVSWEQAFAKMLEARLEKTGRLLDQAGRNFLEVNKNQFYPADVTGYYAETADALQVPLSEQEYFFNNLNSIMATMDYEGQLTDVAVNPMLMGNVRQLASNGSGNANNTEFQLLGYDFHQSNRITNNVGVRATGYAVAPNSVAFATRPYPDSVTNGGRGTFIGSEENPVKAWYQMKDLPIINQPMDVLYQADCADISAYQAAGVTGMTASKVESWQFSLDYAFIGAYNDRPTADYSPIVKFEFLNA